jgi:predicted DNA-binding protein
MSTKNMTVRMDPEMASALEAVARTDEMPVSEVVRKAIDAHIETRRADLEFRERLAKIIEEDREILERLRDEPVTAASSASRHQQQAVQFAPTADA